MTEQVPWGKVFPPMPEQFQMPFWYLSLQSFWVYYAVDAALVASLLPDLPPGEGVQVARFEGLGDQRALVSLDFQAYTSSWYGGLEMTREIEFNVYVYPEASKDVPLMPWQQYLRGNDQTKTIGGWRLHVPCDNPVAIQAGTELFGEPKFLAAFDYTTPSLNSPAVVTWSYGVYDQAPPPPGTNPSPDKLVARVDADLSAVPSTPVNLTPLVEYGAITVDGRPRLVGNVWNFFGPFDTYFLDDASARKVALHLGPAYDKERMREDLQAVIGSTPPIAAQTYQSPAVSSESRAFFPTPT